MPIFDANPEEIAFKYKAIGGLLLLMAVGSFFVFPAARERGYQSLKEGRWIPAMAIASENEEPKVCENLNKAPGARSCKLIPLEQWIEQNYPGLELREIDRESCINEKPCKIKFSLQEKGAAPSEE